MRIGSFALLLVAIVSCKNIQSNTTEVVDSNDTLIATEAIALYYDGNYEESMQLLNSSIGKHPEVAELYFWKGKNHVAQDSLQLALESYSEAIRLDTDNPKYVNNRGLLLFQLQSFDQAEIDLRKALELESTLGIGYNNLGLVYNSRGQYDSAIYFYNRAINNNYKDRNVHYNKAIAFINMAEFDSAKCSLNNVIELDPTFAEAYLYRGLCYYKVGDKLNGCSDFWEAKTLGVEEVDEYLEYCKN